MNHLCYPQQERSSERDAVRRYPAPLASRHFTLTEHPALTRAREVLGTVPANYPRLQRRTGSFAFST